MIEILKTNQTVFSLNDLSILLKDHNYDNLKSKISYYAKKGYLNRIRKGIYVKDNFDKFELACKIYTPSYISFETVLLKEGIIYQYSDIIFVASYLSRYIELDYNGNLIKIQYRKIKDNLLFDVEGIDKKGFYSIASKDRAVKDMKYLKKDFYFDNL